ncbi:TetR/AcrR family transcriptional regulator [Mucilaginibacter limnophilus]|uniref:TetR/AcrR family transcriptional regulator n=1 Tax=Mucilaginibacter limnophilus TaxID=1932778 RepID=A0A3S2V779_9SPHI|nr:TetR/AcrR family transcriptional regulator [Mucilaginibacter limnophilus]RVU00190.1 TetR/AcrR family transcriptional regulator [Mucilaginibacter limnophilus]
MARTKDFNEDEVLNKAVCLFWHRGYNGTSMQDLVDTLGISRSSLYDTFGDKHALYIKALERYQEKGSNQINELLNQKAPAKEVIKQLLELSVSSLLNDEQKKGCFMVNAEVEGAAHDDTVKAIVCKGDQQMEDAFYRVISKGQQSGEITNKQDAKVLARFIFNTIKGIRVTARSTGDKKLFSDIINTTMLLLD